MNDFIKLSWWQRWKLRKYFKAVHAANDNCDDAAIGAQIWSDGMHVKLFLNEQGRVLSKALGGNFTKTYASSAAKRAAKPG